MELEKNELKNYNNKNIHHNKHLSNQAQSKVINRLYKEDIEKRKEKKQTLLKIYECSFQPNLHYGVSTKQNNNNITSSAPTNKNHLMVTKSSRFSSRNNRNNSNFDNGSNNRSLILKSKKNKFNDFDEEESIKTKNKNRSKSKKSKKKKKIIESDEESGGEEELNQDEIIVNRLRAKLFFNKKSKSKNKQRMNHSVEGRKKMKIKM